MESVEAGLELHGLKMEHIQTEMKGLKEKVDRLEIKDQNILGDLSKLDQKVTELGAFVSSITPSKVYYTNDSMRICIIQFTLND